MLSTDTIKEILDLAKLSFSTGEFLLWLVSNIPYIAILLMAVIIFIKYIHSKKD